MSEPYGLKICINLVRSFKKVAPLHITPYSWSDNLFDWTQRLSLTSTISNVDLTWSGAFYHNEIVSSPSVNTFFMDASAVWRLKVMRIRAILRNILNKREYAVTTYSGVGVFTNSYELRPRELLISVQFSLGSW